MQEVKETTFEFEYSAKKQKEVEEIRKKYLPKEEDKMELLRKLDQSAEHRKKITPQVLALTEELMN